MKALRRGTYCFLAALLGVAAPCGAKTNQGGDEGATEQTLIKKLEYRRLPDVNIRKLLKEDRQALNRFEGGGLLPVRIAAPADAGPFTFKDFKWYGSESTGYIGLLGLKSKGALAQAVKIVHFDMPEGTKLWLYDPQQKFPAGPYAPTAGRENPAIWTPAVAGEKLVILIRSRVRPSAESDGLQIKTVMQTYRGAGEQNGPLGSTEAPCQYKVCAQSWSGSPLKNIAAAVSMYTVWKEFPGTGPNAGIGTYSCTGTRLNNLNLTTAIPPEPRRFILSAYHCLDLLAQGVVNHPDYEKDLAATINFYWNFQSCSASQPPPCTGSPNCNVPSTSYPYTSGGADIRASWRFDSVALTQTDFMLLEPKNSAIHQPTTGNSYSPHWAGWTTAQGAPSSAYGLHHPQGDFLALSQNSGSVSDVQSGQSTCDLTNHPQYPCIFWRVVWDTAQGTGTEKGSSGSCLFNASGQCVGMLRSGTDAVCTSNTTTMTSEYGMFSASWNGPNTITSCSAVTMTQKETSLRCWLDPNDTFVNNPPPSMTGDTHIQTTNGVRYDFQAVGEFVTLREPGGFEVQTRQSAVGASPHIDPTTGLNLCVSVNTAVAARVGKHRVTYQAGSGGGSTDKLPPLELRVDGKLLPLGSAIIELDDGGRIVPQAGQDNLQIHFPDRRVLTVTANPWSNIGWYLNVDLQRGTGMRGSGGEAYSMRGIGGDVAAGEWLPDLPNGSHVRPPPVTSDDRYDRLYVQFADAWRVKPGASLFDYAPGTSTDTYTLKSWPRPLNGQCIVPGQRQETVPPNAPDARVACEVIRNEHERANCEFDVEVSRNAQVAKGYEASQRLRSGGTMVTVQKFKPHRFDLLHAHFFATVRAAAPMSTEVPAGSVIFMVDGRDKSQPIDLDEQGQAKWSTGRFKARHHVISVRYIPSSKGGTDFLTSTSAGIGGPDRHH